MNDERLIAAAAGALERGNAIRALEHLQSVEQPTAFAWHLRALALATTGKDTQAQEALERGLALDPGNPELLLLRAELLEQLASPRRAEEAYLDLLRANPNHVNGLLGYGWLLATNGDSEGARAVLDRVAGHLRDESPGALALAGMIACTEGNVRESRAYLQQGLQADPNSVRLHALRAVLAQESGESTKRASGHLHAAAQLDPRQAAELGYQARYLDHWAMAPIRLVDRIGTARLWLLWIGTFFTLRALWPDGPIGRIVLAYITFALYTWIAPPILRWWLRRKGEL